MRARLLVPVLLTATLVAGCGGEDDDDPTVLAPTSAAPTSSSATPTASATPTPSAAGSDAPADGEPPFRSDASPDTAPAARAGNGLSVVDVRVGQHEGYDRVVFELGGEGQAGWTVSYEDDPATQGAGDPVDVGGTHTLVVLIDGVGYPFEVGVEEYGGPRRFSPEAAVVQEVQLGGVFEGRFDAFVGVDGERPFRVFRLDGPQRVVVDVAYGD